MKPFNLQVPRETSRFFISLRLKDLWVIQREKSATITTFTTAGNTQMMVSVLVSAEGSDILGYYIRFNLTSVAVL